MKKIITILILAMTISIQAEGLVSQDTTSTKITNKVPIGKVIRPKKSNRQRRAESLAGLAERADRLEAEKPTKIQAPNRTQQDWIEEARRGGEIAAYIDSTTQAELPRIPDDNNTINIIIIVILAALLMFAIYKASKRLTIKITIKGK